jgi:hypothetical protein
LIKDTVNLICCLPRSGGAVRRFHGNDERNRPNRRFS